MGLYSRPICDEGLPCLHYDEGEPWQVLILVCVDWQPRRPTSHSFLSAKPIRDFSAGYEK